MAAPAPRRGVCYRVYQQREGTVGLLVVSNNRRNRNSEEVTAVPIRREPGYPPSIPLADDQGYACLDSVVRLPTIHVQDPVLELEQGELKATNQALADLQLLPEVCATPPVRPGSPGGRYPRWGRIYRAEPPLGGQLKRWLVVSHDQFNASTDRVLCLRTTSNTSLNSTEAPFIQRGFAVAVCPDTQTKFQERFELDSAEDLEQASFDEMRAVAIGLANYFVLHREAGLIE